MSFISYDDWGAPTAKAIIRLGARELDLVTQYTVHPYDQVLGLYFAQARMYDATDRRFVAMDVVVGNILNSQSLNRYAYVLNKPLIFLDLDGLTAKFHLYFLDHNGLRGTTYLGSPMADGKFKAVDAYGALGDIKSFLPKVTDNDHISMGDFVLMLNALVKGAWGNDTGDYRGRYPGYYFTLVCDHEKGSYTISLSAFTQRNVHALAARIRSNTASTIDYALLQRLQSSYSPYEASGMSNLYREFLFLTDPSHSTSLTDAMLRESLKAMNASQGYLPKYDDPILSTYDYDLYRAYIAASQGRERDELEGLLHGISILQAAAGVSTFVIGLKSLVSDYRNANSLVAFSFNRTYYRAMSEAEYNAVKSTGYLRGGNPGRTYFTNRLYSNASTAQEKLALGSRPDYMIEFKIINRPSIHGGNVVLPDYGYSGGGIEYFSNDPILVDIVNVYQLP